VTTHGWNRIKEIFEGALDVEPSDRDRYLDEACGSNASMRAEVASLLAAHEKSVAFDSPVYEVAAGLLVDEPPAAMPRTLGPYILRQEIGRGGMGVVYLADDTRLSRRVALKAVVVGTGSDRDRRERLRKEAQAAAALSHPGIATVYALEEIGSELYLASEYVPGQTLRILLANGPLSLPLVIDVALQVARALDAAHGQGVVHGDLKPENAVRTPAGVVKILDFGLARADHVAVTGLTHSQTGAGTPGYMAPEQIRGEPPDFQADLFAFGVVVYEMASGFHPFEASTPAAVTAKVLEAVQEPLTRAGVPGSEALDAVVTLCLAKDRRQRYSSTRELVADLEQLHVGSAAVTRARRRSRAVGGWWWEFHQIAVVVLYLALLYPAWQIRHWLTQPWETLFLCSVAGFAAMAVTVRLHLWFTARHDPANLPAALSRARTWRRGSDLALTGTLLTAGLAIAREHPATGMLLVATAIAAALAAFLIEPATARAAFGDS
jgi:hypothetical protein